MEINYRIEVKELGMYSVSGKVFKNNVYLGEVRTCVNDTNSLIEGMSYDFNSRTNVDNVTFGLQMEIKKFLINIGLEASNKTKRSKETSWTY